MSQDLLVEISPISKLIPLKEKKKKKKKLYIYAYNQLQLAFKTNKKIKMF